MNIFSRAAGVTAVLLIGSAGLVAFGPFTARAQSSAVAAHGAYFQVPPGRFELGPGEIEQIVFLKHPALYRVCFDHGKSRFLIVHFDADADQTLRQGQCHDYEASTIKVEATPGEVTARGTYHLVYNAM